MLRECPVHGPHPWHGAIIAIASVAVACGADDPHAASDVAVGANGDDEDTQGTSAAETGSVTPGTATTSLPQLPQLPQLPRLEPAADCFHPEVFEDCSDGFCFVPAGCFVMGAPRDSWGASAYDDVEVQVTLSRGFLLGETEVTRELWQAEGLALPVRDIPGEGLGSCLEQHCPVVNVNVFDVLEFVNRYSLNRGLEPCYELRDCSGEVGAGPECQVDPETSRLIGCDASEPGFDCQGVYCTADTVYDCAGYRLPTEAEWEYAARAGTRTATWEGDLTMEPIQFSCFEQDAITSIAWYCYNAEGHAFPVGTKPRNPWGLFDMLGNVSERLMDLPSGLGYGDGPLIDPVGVYVTDRNLMPEIPTTGLPANRTSTVERGGDYLSWAHIATAPHRYDSSLQRGHRALGFRLARTLQESE